MSGLTMRRIILIFLLVASVAALSFYQIAYANDNSQELIRLMNNRKQKDDYKSLFDDANFKTITITFTDEVFNELIASMESYFESYGTYQDNTMHPVTMTYSDGEGNTFSVEEVGFRTKSNTSRNIPLTYDWRGRPIYHQTSFQLQFDATFDYEDHSNAYAVLSSREAFNLKQLNFEFCKMFEGNYDEAMISEAYAYYLYEQAGVVVSNASYGLVYFQIGDELVAYGFYTIIEPIDKTFLENHFKSDAIGGYGDLYKSTDISGAADLSVDSLSLAGVNETEINERYSYALKTNTLGGTRQTHTALSEFIYDLDEPEYFLAHADEIVDVDSFLRALAMDFLIGNTDDYRYNFNNFYLYFNVYTNRAVYIPFDLDNALGFGKHQDLSGNYGVYYPLFSSTDDRAVLVKRIFENPDYVDAYYGYLESFTNELFSYNDFYNQFITAKDLYQSILISENHLGNQVFGLRNIAWYMTTKRNTVLSLLAEASS